MAPYQPQSNGQAEKFVDTLKTGLKKLEGEGNADQILRKSLMCYRYTVYTVVCAWHEGTFSSDDGTTNENKIRLA